MTLVLRADFTPAVFRRHWGTLLLFALVQILGGAFAMAAPAIVSLLATAVFGWMLILSAVFQFVHAYRVRNWSGFALHLSGAVLYAFAGVAVLFNPFPGVAALTLIVAALLLAEGLVRCVLALRLRGGEGWLWFLSGGIASIVLGVVLLSGWPSTALWALGLLLGVNLVFSGAMNVALALDCRRRILPSPPRGRGPNPQ